MAIEIITDADSGTSTVGDTAVNLAGNYAATVLGATFQWCAGFFGAYTAFTRIVTGVTIDIQAPISINIFGGFRFVLQGGAVYTVSKIKELNVQADVMKKITNLQTLLTNQTQFIENCTDEINVLNQNVDELYGKYNVVETVGGTSTEEWSESMSIMSSSYSLRSDGSASISSVESTVSLTPSGVGISGPLIELGD